METKYERIETTLLGPDDTWLSLRGIAVSCLTNVNPERGVTVIVPSALRQAAQKFLGIPLLHDHAGPKIGVVSDAEFSVVAGTPCIVISAEVPRRMKQNCSGVALRALSLGADLEKASRRKDLERLAPEDLESIGKVVFRHCPEVREELVARKGVSALVRSLYRGLRLKIYVGLRPREVSLVSAPADSLCYIDDRDVKFFLAPWEAKPEPAAYRESARLGLSPFIPERDSQGYISAFERHRLRQEIWTGAQAKGGDNNGN